jgi:outer membrane protein assembly factor BamB
MGCRLGCCLLLCFGITVSLAGPIVAQESLQRVGLSGESPGTAKRLAAADQLAAAGKWTEALDDYLRLLAESGDDLVPFGPRHSVSTRRLCHLRLAALPAATLQLYRERVDPALRQRWEQAQSARDVPALRLLVANAFCSRHADQAVDLLGNCAWERGASAEARFWWSLLALPAAAKNRREPSVLLYPDPEVDVARVRAKQILAQLLQGDRHGAEEEWHAFQALHPRAGGWLAGQEGNYAAVLGKLLRQPEHLASLGDSTWATFAGNPSRTGAVAQAPSPIVWELPPWQVPWEILPIKRRPSDSKTLTATAANQRLAIHPLIVDGQVLVADAQRVLAYDLVSGRLNGRFDLPPESRSGPLTLEFPPALAEEPQFTLTAYGGCVYARLGGEAVGTHRQGKDTVCDDSYLFCLDLRCTVDGKLQPRWQVKAQERKTVLAMFEGAPVVQEGRVYIARISLAEGRESTAIDCYQAVTGTRLWRQTVCEVRHPRRRTPRRRHYLLTLAGPNIVYCSHTGAIVAVDALTGSHVWAARYPSYVPDAGEEMPTLRALAPCVWAENCVYAAPADYDRILALDAASGRLLWESAPVQVVDLLGVAEGKLLFTSSSQPRGLRALDMGSGAALRAWVQPDDGQSDLPPLGRGFVAGHQVFWPTFYGLRVLDLENAQPVLVEHQPLGNLAVGEGCVAVADADKLRVYVAPARQLERREKEAAAYPRSAVDRYWLALAETDAGLADRALKRFAQAEQLAAPEDLCNGRSLREPARHQRQQLLAPRQSAARRAGSLVGPHQSH